MVTLYVYRMENSAYHAAIFLNALICRLPAGLRPCLERLEAVVEPGDGDLGVGGGPRRVDDADKGERVLQHHRDDRGQLQAVGFQHQLQKVPEMHMRFIRRNEWRDIRSTSDTLFSFSMHMYILSIVFLGM